MNFRGYSALGGANTAPLSTHDNGTTMAQPYGLPIIKTDEVRTEVCIGSGGFGKVYRAQIIPAGREPYQAAVKIPHNSDNNDLRQEALIFNLLQNANIVRMMGLIVDENSQNKGLILEYCSGGPLNNWLKLNQNVLTLRCSIDWSLQVALGMEYLHKRAPAKLLHRDLKSSNVLLLYPQTCPPESQIMKITDFGLARARPISTEQECLSQEQFSAAGTYAWMAPESIRSNNFSPYSDVWSFGVLVWEILTGEIPYRGLEPLQVAFSVAHRQMRLPIPSSIPETLRSLMSRCWAENSHERPEFDVIKTILHQAKDEFQDYDKSGEFRSLQTTWKAEVRGMLTNLKEKAGELKSKEMELAEREKAVSRRQQDLQQRELDVVKREISVLLKEQEHNSSRRNQKEKKKGKKSDRISNPSNFEHWVAVKNRGGGLKVVEPKAKTWGHKNGEVVQAQINARHSSSTSDMDKVGKNAQKYSTITNAINPATLIIGSIGLSKDIFNLSQVQSEQNEQETIRTNTPIKTPTRVPQTPVNFSDSSISPSPAPRVRRSTESTVTQREHTPVTRPICSSPPGPECTRPRPRRFGHKRVPSEPIELGEIAQVARQLEHTNVIQKQEILFNGTIMSGSGNRRPQSAGPPVNRLNLMKPIPIDVRSSSGPTSIRLDQSIPTEGNTTPSNWPQKTSPVPLKPLEAVSKGDFGVLPFSGDASFGSRYSQDIPSSSTLPNSLHMDPLNDDMIRFDPT